MIRNFFLEAAMGGRKCDVTAGPRGKDGEMTIRLYQNNKGTSELALRIECFALEDGLKTVVFSKGEKVMEHTTSKK